MLSLSLLSLSLSLSSSSFSLSPALYMDLDLSLGTSPAEPLKKAFSGGGAAASGGTPAIGLKLGFCRVENIKEREAEQRRGSVHHLQAFSQEIDNTILEAPARELDAGGGGGGGAGELGFSDEEENAGAKKKLRLTREQSVFLEENFKEHSTLKPKQKAALAKQLNLRPRQVEVWFQNRRARTKLKQTEVDCEYLKRCCEALTEENRRLQKELSELRALKSAHPFYAELPATTLSICAACDRASKPVTAGTDSRQSGTFTALFAKVHFHALTNPAVTPSHQSSAAS